MLCTTRMAKSLVGVLPCLSPMGRGPRSGAVAGESQHAAEFDVPAEHAGLLLHDLIERLRVDVTSKEHKLVAKRA
jgi:hypothetical protein